MGRKNNKNQISTKKQEEIKANPAQEESKAKKARGRSKKVRRRKKERYC